MAFGNGHLQGAERHKDSGRVEIEDIFASWFKRQR